MHVHNSIRHLVTRRHNIETNKIEVIWLEVKQPKMSSKLLAYVYRNPAADDSFYDHFSDMIDAATKICTDITILGDLNFNLLKPNEKPQQLWSTVTEQFGLTQFVHKPTRYDIQHKTWTLLDHIYSTDNHSVINAEV